MADKTTNGENIIVINSLTKRFGERVVLDSISLAIEKGKTTVIIGPSGCGKTVLIKHMVMLLRPTSGEIYFKDQRLDTLREEDINEVRTHFGFLFQGGALFDSDTVYQNIIFPLTQHTKKIGDWKAVDELVKNKLALVGLDGYQNYYPANLSGGQKKRVALARAIALNPEVVFYDEPTTGLDPVRSDVINELILKLKKELAITSVVVTHDMTSAYKIADRIVMLHKGKIIADGDPDYIRNHPDDVVRDFTLGQVSEADLAALRLGGTKFSTQFEPQDFE
ncbi:MAG: ABC transporter ATP-binding protein [Sedimentisphaerales bacterium]|nr:ABC transporter ATP-binding protein [Sedimentisphaerales bacterium]